MIIKASDIKIGTQLAESDGFLFDVVEIRQRDRKNNNGSSLLRLFEFSGTLEDKRNGTPGGVIKTFRKSTKLYGAN